MAHKWWHVWGNQQQNNGLLNADPNTIAGQAESYMIPTNYTGRGAGWLNYNPNATPQEVTPESWKQSMIEAYQPGFMKEENVDKKYLSPTFTKTEPKTVMTPYGEREVQGGYTIDKFFQTGGELADSVLQKKIESGTASEVEKTSKQLDEELGKFHGSPKGKADPEWESTYGTKEGKAKWYENIGGITQNFLDNLDDPTFQTVLNMHIESKNGGDITDVLQAGVKTRKTVTDALLRAKANETSLVKQNLGIIDLLSKIGKTEAPSTSLIKSANELLSKNPYDLGDQTTEAAFAMASMAKALQAQNPSTYPDEYSALMGAIQLAEGSGGIQRDTWLSWGGKFRPENIQPIQTQNTAAMYPTSYQDALTAFQNRHPDASQEDIEAAIQANYPWLIKL